jgi:hypothetical protein
MLRFSEINCLNIFADVDQEVGNRAICFFLGMPSHMPLFSAIARHTMHAIETTIATRKGVAMDDLLGGLIGSAVSGELGATTPVGAPREISAIVASPEKIADAAAALFLRLLQVVNVENTAPPEIAIKQERERAALAFEAINRFIGTAWHDPGRLEVQRYFLLLSHHLLQLNDGVSHPMWSVSSTGKGKKPDAFELWDGRRWVCAAYECYLRCGMSRHAAAHRIAKNRENRPLRRLVHKATETKLRKPGNIDDAKMADSVISWHKEFRENNVPDSIRQLWPATIEIIENHQPTPPELLRSFADVSLKLARKTAAKVALPT